MPPKPGLTPEEKNLVAAATPKPEASQNTSAPSAPSQNTAQLTQLDPKIVNLSKAIRQTESGGNFTAQGKSGEYGAYQYTEPEWQKDSAAAGVSVPLNQSTPEQQNEVAYKTLAARQAAHPDWNIGNQASAWNAGEGEPDAYTGKFSDGSPSVGVNKHGVHYDVPAYAKSVAQAYQTLKGGGQVPNADPNNPSSTAAPQPPQSLGQTIGNVVKGIGSAIFPIIPDLINDIKGTDTKSALQQAGDAGLSALWFLPFGDIAEGIGLGAEALGAGADAAKAAGNIATGFGTGYAADVSSNLSQGQTGGDALQPGVGTALGAAAPVGGMALGSLFNKFIGQQAAMGKVEAAYADAFGATKSGQRVSSEINARSGSSPSQFLAAAGITPETAEINGRRVFTVGPDSETYKTIQQRASDLTNIRDQAIEQSTGKSNLETLRQQVLGDVEKEFHGTERDSAAAHLNSEFDAYAQQFGRDAEGNVSLPDMNKIKTDLQGKTKYDATRPSMVTRANKLAARLTKTQVEDDAESQGVPGIKALNKIIQQHLDFLNTGSKKGLLSKLDGQVIKGGRIGTHVKEAIGGAIGMGAAGAMGGGILGDIIGGVSGAYTGNLVSRWLQKLSVGGPITAATIGRMSREDPQVVQQFLQMVGREGEQVAPVISPIQRSGAGLVQGLLKKSPGSQIIRAATK